MDIKYLGPEKEKKAEAPKGQIYTFKIDETVSVSSKSLCEHLLTKCNGRFVEVKKKKYMPNEK